MQTQEIYEFGPFRLDPSLRRLTRDGKAVPLKPKVFDTLLALVRGRASVLNKDQLMLVVWPDTVVEENNLAQNISVLRKVLGESTEEPPFIVTVPGQGYRFVAPVSEVQTTASESSAVPAAPKRPDPPSRLAFAVLGLLLLIGIAIAVFSFRRGDNQPVAPSPSFPSIAVLPFASSPDDSSDDYLELAMADVLTAQFSKFKQVRVRPMSAVQVQAGTGNETLAVGRKLHVDSVLEGTIKKTGDQIRVTVRLIGTQDGQPLWAGVFEEKFANVLALQNAISSKISIALKLDVTPAERERIYRRYTENISAHESYLQGRSQLLKYDHKQTLAAVQSFEDALKLDANYALAHAGLASASAQMRLRFAKTPQDIKTWEDRAHQEADTALKLDPDLAEAHEALANVYGQTEFDWDKTLEESRLALELNPNLDMPHYLRGRSFYHVGMFERADKESILGSNVTEENLVPRLRVQGVTALFAGRFEEAVKLLQQSKRLNDNTIDWHLAMATYYAGDHERAEMMLAGIHGSAQTEQRAAATWASFLAARGEKEKAKALLRSVGDYGYNDHHVAYSVGVTHAQLGSVAEALRWLTRAKDSGFPCYPWFEQDPLLQPIINDVNFSAFLSNFRKDWGQDKARRADR